MRRSPALSLTFGALALGLSSHTLFGCSDDEKSGSTPGSGGSPAAGGMVSAGGSAAGGTPGSGGASSSGGTSAGGMGGMAMGDAAPPEAGAGVDIEVTTQTGPVTGTTLDGISSFKGIPFADTTGGENRWKPPQPVTPWTEARDAKEYGGICPQITPGSTNYDPGSSEDCLSVNVWTPDVAPAAPLPVMVWIHGGAFIFGSGGGTYDGTKLATAGNLVVVTLNYRLGPLGFMAHEALTTEGGNDASGSYGILDQVAALQWVKDNIGAFGGDPNAVTIFGESAGGRSVCWHLLSPGSQGLFHRAIVESGICLLEGQTLAEAEATGERFATANGCTNPDEALSCMRALPPETLITPSDNSLPGGLFYLDRTDAFVFQPLVDGVVMTDQPEAVFESGAIANVPVIHGSNTAEGALFHQGVLGDTPVMDQTEYEAALARAYEDTDVQTILAEYPVADFASANDALTAVSSDSLFVCPARRMARHLEAAGISNYLYSFNGPLETMLFAELNGKAFHSADIAYVFQNDFVLGTIPEAYAPLADSVQGYWTRHAAAGNPNGEGSVEWVAYTTAADPHLSLDQTIAMGTAHQKDKCDFWDAGPRR